MSEPEHPSGSCIVCKRRDPLPDLEPVCGPCRSRLYRQLAEIPALCTVLAAGPRPDLELGAARTVERADHLVEVDGRLAAVVRVHQERQLGVSAGAVPGQSGAPRVRGSRERPLPIRADAADLLDIADERMVSDYHHVPMVRSTGETRVQTSWFDGVPIRQTVQVREVVATPRLSRCRCGRPELHERSRPVMVPAADQVGRVSVASVLNAWVRDFAETRRETGPEPTVPLLAHWLTDRLDWAFTHHPAIDEFADEIGDVWAALYRACGLTKPQRELCEGVPCKRVDCDLKTLYRVPGSQYIECESCGALLTEAEYLAWCRLLAAAARKVPA